VSTHRRMLALSILATLGPALGCGAQPDPVANGDSEQAEDAVRRNASRKVVLFVWDGLRPDLIDDTNTPNLAALSRRGTSFQDNHSTYPTFTMMNAASFATGSFPGATGFYGNTAWVPGPMGSDSAAHAFDFSQPVFMEDYALLTAIGAYYQDELLLVGTLFKAAQERGKTTVTVGKSGAAFIQDYARGGLIIDEKMAWPLSFAQELQGAGFALPALSSNAYSMGMLTLGMMNGDPTAATPKKTLADGSTPDPADSSGGQPNASNAYLMSIYVDYILPNKRPDLSVIWLRSPDSTQHTYGLGVPNSIDALRAQDHLLGDLLSKLHDIHLDTTTDVIVASDHGHSSVAGPADLFPLRAITSGAVGDRDDENGYSVSGSVRLADLMTRAGFHAFDGQGCAFEPVMSGLKKDGTNVYATQVDQMGTICGTAGRKYSTASFKVPQTLPDDAVVIAMNGGSDYVYVPSHDAAQVEKVVRFIQTREEYAAVFVDEKYGDIPGTLALQLINAADSAGRNPDIVASLSFDADAVVQGVSGTEMSSMFGGSGRGMHGTFSRRDVHNTLVAAGPDFRRAFEDPLPTGNVDVAPTIARILGVSLPGAEGRPLLEALVRGGAGVRSYDVAYVYAEPTVPADGLTMALPTDPDGHEVDLDKSYFSFDLLAKQLTFGSRKYIYFDTTEVSRQ
jgi:arylsulfatase A-like enzyme